MPSWFSVGVRGRVAACLAVAGLTAALLNAIGVFGTITPTSATTSARPEAFKAVLESSDEWLGKIKSETFWADKRASAKKSSSPRVSTAKASQPSTFASASKVTSKSSSEDRDETDQTYLSGAAWYHGDGDTFKTICVRLCDGFQFPISFSTTEDQFEADSVRCQQSCTSPARLFVIKTPAGSDDELRDLKGLPYKRLKTADAFRTSFVEDCKCRPHAWEQQAMDRHRMYAADTKRKTGDVVAAAEFERLKASLAQATESERRLLAIANEKANDFVIAETKDASSRKSAKSERGTKPFKAAARTGRKPAPKDETDDSGEQQTVATASPPRRAVGSGPPTVMRLGGAVTTAARAPAPVAAPRPKVQRASARSDAWRRDILSGANAR